MIEDLSGDKNTLTKWMGAVDADLPSLRPFTTGLRRDLGAVVARLTLEWHREPHQSAQGGVGRCPGSKDP